MKKEVLFIVLITLILGSCNMDLGENENGEDIPIIGEIIDVRLKIAIVDQLLQDRLNPDSKSYFGEKYAKEIKVLYLFNNEKRTISSIWPDVTNGQSYLPEDYEEIQAPFRETENYGSVDQNSLGYYFLHASSYFLLDDVTDTSYTYVRYPNGEEDEIKVQIFKNRKGNITRIRKIWINGELAYSVSENSVLFMQGMLPDSVDTTDPDMFLNYYNPKNYPFLEQTSDHKVYPKNGSDVVVIIK
ncbi:MAG: hypothetical protein LBH58_04130 [Tannerellaceae bacterium]|jgi:hypothetical protein|nr:hypothetical protein [Tannerellaceae bacterium]